MALNPYLGPSINQANDTNTLNNALRNIDYVQPGIVLNEVKNSDNVFYLAPGIFPRFRLVKENSTVIGNNSYIQLNSPIVVEANAYLKDLTINSGTNSSELIRVTNGATLMISDCVLQKGPETSAIHIVVDAGSTLIIANNYFTGGRADGLTEIIQGSGTVLCSQNANLTGNLLSSCTPTVYAPVDATYVTLSTNPVLTNERVLTAGAGISLVDGGAGSTITVASTVTGSDRLNIFGPLVNQPSTSGTVTLGYMPWHTTLAGAYTTVRVTGTFRRSTSSLIASCDVNFTDLLGVTSYTESFVPTGTTSTVMTQTFAIAGNLSATSTNYQITYTRNGTSGAAYLESLIINLE